MRPRITFLPRGERLTWWQGSWWRVDPTGVYYQLIVEPPEMFEPTETHQNGDKVERYAAMYRAGSPFPPLSVSGTTPEHPLYAINNGHHRWLAAREVQVPALAAWTCFYYPFIGAYERTYWLLARMSNTEEGRALARHVGMEWCPQCGGFLNYTPGEPLCRSCAMYLQVCEQADTSGKATLQTARLQPQVAPPSATICLVT